MLLGTRVPFEKRVSPATVSDRPTLSVARMRTTAQHRTALVVCMYVDPVTDRQLVSTTPASAALFEATAAYQESTEGSRQRGHHSFLVRIALDVIGDGAMGVARFPPAPTGTRSCP
jgi:hypothetical protein